MRKDVRLGLAVGSSLFIIVLAYILFFTGARPPGEPVATGPVADRGGGPIPQTPVLPAPPIGGGAGALPGDRPIGPTGGNTGGGTLGPTGGTQVGSGGVVVIDGPGRDGASGTPRAGAGPLDPASGALPTDSGNPIAAGAESGAGESRGTTSSSFGGHDWSRLMRDGWSGAIRSETPGTLDTPRSTPGGTSASAGAGAGPIGIDDSTIISVRPTGPRTYVVKANDTYWSIAKSEYGNAQYYPHLARANPAVPASALRAGMTITLPDKAAVVPISTPLSTPTPPPADTSKEYRVLAGDNLTNIARKLYGRTDKATIEKLYELNKDRIGPNPSALKQNMVLTLPEPPTVTASLQ